MIKENVERLWNIIGVAVLFTGVALIGPEITAFVTNTLHLSASAAGIVLLLAGGYIFGRDK